MPTPTLEDRVTALEQELAELKKSTRVSNLESSPHPWDKIYGSMADSEGFDEAVRLGKEYRDSQQPEDEKDT